MTVISKSVISKNEHSAFFGPVIPPNNAISANTMSFGTVKVRDYSASQSVIISGSGLVNPITVTAPNGFIVNTDNGSGNMSPLTLNPILGVVNETVYIKFAPSIYQVYAAANVTVVSTGLATLNIAVDGTGDLQIDLKNWYDALVGAKPTNALTYALQGLMQGYEDDGIIGRTDLLHIILGLETNEQRVTPFRSTSGAISVGVGTYSLDANGFKGDGSTGYLRLGWAAASGAVRYAQDDSCSFFYSRTLAGSGASGSIETGKSLNYIYPQQPDGKCHYGINTNIAGLDDKVTVANSKGLYFIKRTGASTPTFRKDAVTVGSGFKNSDQLNTIEEYLGAINTNGVATDFSDHRYCMYGRGDSSINDYLLLSRLQNYAVELAITL